MRIDQFRDLFFDSWYDPNLHILLLFSNSNSSSWNDPCYRPFPSSHLSQQHTVHLINLFDALYDNSILLQSCFYFFLSQRAPRCCHSVCHSLVVLHARFILMSQEYECVSWRKSWEISSKLVISKLYLSLFHHRILDRYARPTFLLYILAVARLIVEQSSMTTFCLIPSWKRRSEHQTKTR